jgi:hypothetical protein
MVSLLSLAKRCLLLNVMLLLLLLLRIVFASSLVLAANAVAGRW